VPRDFHLVGGPAHGQTVGWSTNHGRYLVPVRRDEVVLDVMGRPDPIPHFTTETVAYEPLWLRSRTLGLLVVVDDRDLRTELLRLEDERRDANQEAAELRSGAECRRLIRVAAEAAEWFDHIVRTGERPGEAENPALEFITYGRPGLGRTYAVERSGTSYARLDAPDQSWSVPVVADSRMPEHTVVMAMDGTTVAAFEMLPDGSLRQTRAFDGRVVQMDDT